MSPPFSASPIVRSTNRAMVALASCQAEQATHADLELWQYELKEDFGARSS